MSVTARCDVGFCSEPFKLADTGSIPVRVTGMLTTRCDVGFYSQALNLAHAGSIPVRVTKDSQVVELGYTRCSERRAHLGMRVRLSPWLLTLQVRQVPSRVS